jgi:hypothetical protein
MRASSTPGRRWGHILARSGIGGSISLLLSAVLHSWLPLVIVGSLIGAVILIAGAAILVPILRGANPIVECGSFKLTFDNGKGEGPRQITGGGRR